MSEPKEQRHAIPARFLNGPLHMQVSGVPEDLQGRIVVEVQEPTALELPDGSKPSSKHVYQLQMVPFYIYMGPEDVIRDLEEKMRGDAAQKTIEQASSKTLGGNNGA